VKSYEVERSFYGYHASKQKDARIPHCWGTAVKGEETLLVLEDLDESGYPVRKTDVVWSEIACCLEWLANFHATNMQVPAKDLWETGTYWHLNTRPEELQVLKDVALKNAAPKLDAMLTNANYQTIVHGDAKLANFCFSETGDAVAAVDFQYAGGGVGIKDVAYFVGSCLREEDCERLEEKILATYFKALQNALQKKEAFLCFEDLEAEWRALYPIAWTDFYRFLKGWSPNHWKINSYSEKTAIGVLARI
jgi:thiamine kinase-like enzyme